MESSTRFDYYKREDQVEMGQNTLMNPKGKLPTKDTRTFNRILKIVVENWELTKPVDLMMANRMVATWMRLKYVESKLEEIGLTQETDKGILIMNPLAGYSRTLENDLMRFYRLFQARAPKEESTGPANFAEWLDENAKEIGQGKDKD